MSKQQPIILIHGAWHAAWCWQKTAHHLLEAGYTVLTPDLPGHGIKRVAAKTITFNAYTQSVIDLIKAQSQPVTLVGHSMAGLVVSQVAEVMPEAIKSLVYVAAHIPRHGQSLLSIAEQSISRGLSPHLDFDRVQGEIKLAASNEVMSLLYHLCSEEDKAHARNHLQSQPLQPFAATVSLSSRFQNVNKKAILCRHDRALVLADQEKMCEDIIDDVLIIDSDHSPFYSASLQLARAITQSEEKI